MSETHDLLEKIIKSSIPNLDARLVGALSVTAPKALAEAFEIVKVQYAEEQDRKARS